MKEKYLINRIFESRTLTWILIAWIVIMLSSCASYTSNTYSRSDVRESQSKLRQENIMRQYQRDQRSSVFPYKQND